MKRLFTLLILCIPFLCFSQSALQGDWQLSTVKLLRLNADNSFHLTKGAFHHYGTYESYSKSNTTILKLNFETVSIDYEILSLSDDKLELKDLRNSEMITAKRKKTVTSTSKELVKSEERVTTSFPKENPFIQNHYRNLYPDNQYYFSLGGNGGLSWASGTSLASYQEGIGNVTEEFSVSPTYSYGAGFKFGYQFGDGFYLGTGGSYQYTGFRANRKASTSDPEYQFDAESSQTARYTYSSIDVPLWLSYRFADKWMLELGALISIPLRNTSKAVFNGENTVYVNGEIDARTSYTSDEYTQQYPNILEDYAFGGYGEIQRRLAKHLIFSISYKHIKDFMQFDTSPISNNSIQANLILQLF